VHRLIDPLPLALQLGDQRLALLDGVAPLTCRLLTILRRPTSIPRGQLALLGGSRASLHRSPLLTRRPNDHVRIAQRTRHVLLIGRRLKPRRRDIALLSRDISRAGLAIAKLRGLVTLVGGVHMRSAAVRGSSSLSLLCERIAVGARNRPLPGCLIAVVRCALAVLRRPSALLGGFRAVLPGTLALLGSGHRDVGTAERGRVVVALTSAVALDHRQVALVGGPISRPRHEIAGVGDPVAYVGALQTLPRGLITLIAGPIALISGVLTHVLTAVVLLRAATGREVTITGRLIGIGRDLVAVSARLVAIGARLIGV